MGKTTHDPRPIKSEYSFRVLSESVISAERTRFEAMALELQQRAAACSAAIATGNVPDIKEAVYHLIDAEYELTGDSEAFGFLYDQYGIVDGEYAHHLDEIEDARVMSK